MCFIGIPYFRFNETAAVKEKVGLLCQLEHDDAKRRNAIVHVFQIIPDKKMAAWNGVAMLIRLAPDSDPLRLSEIAVSLIWTTSPSDIELQVPYLYLRLPYPNN